MSALKALIGVGLVAAIGTVVYLKKKKHGKQVADLYQQAADIRQQTADKLAKGAEMRREIHERGAEASQRAQRIIDQLKADISSGVTDLADYRIN